LASGNVGQLLNPALSGFGNNEISEDGQKKTFGQAVQIWPQWNKLFWPKVDFRELLARQTDGEALITALDYFIKCEIRDP
jgi:hypothetical protein